MAELDAIKQRQKRMWSVGDFPGIAWRIESASVAVIDAAEPVEGTRLLDVATGTGNAALIAAERGARASGLDLVPKLLDVARERAAAAGVELELVEGDAENLPWEDGSFDRVVSVFGTMFAPHHPETAAEMARTCRPGGRIAVAAWTPEGVNGQMFIRLAGFMPPPPEGFQPPVLWGVEEHVRELFGGFGEVTCERRNVRFEDDSVDGWIDYCEDVLGPVILAKEALEPEGRWPEAREELVALTESTNQADGGALAFDSEYLLTVVDLGA